VDDRDCFLSVLTLGEIRSAVERLRARDPQHAAVFDAWLDELRQRFADRILPVDDGAADRWGRLNATAPRKTIESLIASVAYARDLAVATGNTRDFEQCGVRVVNPWEFGSSDLR
jgi:hypothetical protein